MLTTGWGKSANLLDNQAGISVGIIGRPLRNGILGGRVIGKDEGFYSRNFEGRIDGVFEIREKYKNGDMLTHLVVFSLLLGLYFLHSAIKQFCLKTTPSRWMSLSQNTIRKFSGNKKSFSTSTLFQRKPFPQETINPKQQSHSTSRG
jgi:hypothetical protein